MAPANEQHELQQRREELESHDSNDSETFFEACDSQCEGATSDASVVVSPADSATGKAASTLTKTSKKSRQHDLSRLQKWLKLSVVFGFFQFFGFFAGIFGIATGIIRIQQPSCSCAPSYDASIEDATIKNAAIGDVGPDNVHLPDIVGREASLQENDRWPLTGQEDALMQVEAARLWKGLAQIAEICRDNSYLGGSGEDTRLCQALFDALPLEPSDGLGILITVSGDLFKHRQAPGFEPSFASVPNSSEDLQVGSSKASPRLRVRNIESDSEPFSLMQMMAESPLGGILRLLTVTASTVGLVAWPMHEGAKICSEALKSALRSLSMLPRNREAVLALCFGHTPSRWVRSKFVRALRRGLVRDSLVASRFGYSISFALFGQLIIRQTDYKNQINTSVEVVMFLASMVLSLSALLVSGKPVELSEV